MDDLIYKCFLCDTMLKDQGFQWSDEFHTNGVVHKPSRCHALMVRAGNRARQEKNPKAKPLDVRKVAQVCLLVLIGFLISCGSNEDYDPGRELDCRIVEYDKNEVLICPLP